MHYRIIRRGQDEQLTKNFNSTEFECSCGTCDGQRINMELVYKLQEIRSELDVPLKVTSGYRCQWYQNQLREQGYSAAKKSQHVLGNAADVSIRKDRFAEFLQLALNHFFCVGIGTKSPWLHLDTRNIKKKVWFYS